jgi:hypothetical protein
VLKISAVAFLPGKVFGIHFNPMRQTYRPRYRRKSSSAGMPKILAGIAAGVVVVGMSGAGSNLWALTTGCSIKGNISINTGERIYHVPGKEHYAETRISPQHGERWFCSEAEARAAGWRKASA